MTVGGIHRKLQGMLLSNVYVTDVTSAKLGVTSAKQMDVIAPVALQCECSLSVMHLQMNRNSVPSTRSAVESPSTVLPP